MLVDFERLLALLALDCDRHDLVLIDAGVLNSRILKGKISFY